MKFIVMHKTSPKWEAGEKPSQELVQRVGGLIADLVREKRFVTGDGLRATSEGVRVTFHSGAPTVTPGPFTGGNELTSSFSIVRTPSIDEAIEFATREAAILGDGEVDIRPVTEGWEIGFGEKPANLTTRRYMIQRKATPATEAGTNSTPAQRSALAQLIDASTHAGIHLARQTMRPSSRGRRYVNSRNGISMFDGPFVESKELLSGFMIITADSLDEAGRWAERYLDVVETDEVDVLELED
jgi:hypothetical protein